MSYPSTIRRKVDAGMTFIIWKAEAPPAGREQAEETLNFLRSVLTFRWERWKVEGTQER